MGPYVNSCERLKATKLAGRTWKVQLWWENIHVLTEKAWKFSGLAERKEEGEVVPHAGDRVKKIAVGRQSKSCRRTWEARQSRSP